MEHLTVKDSREDSCTPATGLEILSSVGEGPFVKKMKKSKKKRHRKSWTHPPRQQKPIKDPGIQRKTWTRFSRHRKEEDGSHGRRWSLRKEIRKAKKEKKSKFSRGSQALQQGPKAKMKA